MISSFSFEWAWRQHSKNTELDTMIRDTMFVFFPLCSDSSFFTSSLPVFMRKTQKRSDDFFCSVPLKIGVSFADQILPSSAMSRSTRSRDRKSSSAW
jgi:hypothetical protein